MQARKRPGNVEETQRIAETRAGREEVFTPVAAGTYKHPHDLQHEGSTLSVSDDTSRRPDDTSRRPDDDTAPRYNDPAKRSDEGYRRPDDSFRRPEDSSRRPDESFRRPDDSPRRPDEGYRRSDTTSRRPDDSYRRPDDSYRRPDDSYRRPDETVRRPEPPARNSADDAVRRFTDLIRLTGMKTRYIDKAQEHRLLEKGVVSFRLSLDDARRVLRKTAEEDGYVFESEEGRRIEQLLSRHAGRSGTISREQFESTALILRDFSEKSIGEEDARRQLKRLMLQHGWQPRRSVLSWSRKWFEQVKV